ncbi:MAG: hypothetical protein K6E92_01465 [Lachnospiraceae bacterium]|nr:hypothetical protein [Lachnospiraceae bacterium]
MDVVDTKRLATAILYLQRITEGRNPVNNMELDEDAVLSNPNVQRCMTFVKEVLEEVKRNDGYIGRRPRVNRDKTKEEFPLECLSKFQYEHDKPVSKFVEQLNALTDTTKYKRLDYKSITTWLKENGYLIRHENGDDGSIRTLPTEKGEAIGIRTGKRKDSQGKEYVYIIYNQQAQEFLVQNMAKILGRESQTMQ